MQAAARLVAAFAVLAATSSFAQEPFPSRPVRLVVPVAAGGGIDTAFRAIAPAWSEALGAAGYAAGLGLSLYADLPAGATVVCCLCLLTLAGLGFFRPAGYTGRP